MQEKDKVFILNRGLYLGVFFSLFPLIDLLFGEDMSSRTYYILFFGLWFLITVFLIYFFGKEYRSVSDFFDFRVAFRIIFLVAAIGFTLLTVTRITLWNIFYPDKYIELNENRDIKLSAYVLEYTKSSLDNAYREGNISSDEYEVSFALIEDQIDQAQAIIKQKWDSIRENGLSKTIFIGALVYDLFFISIINAILALIIRRKQQIG